MQRISVLLFLLVFCFATAMQAQAPAPKPDPELKKLLPEVGHWTYEGESKAGPQGPGGKFTGEQDVQMILGGFFQETRVIEKTPAGGTFEELEIDGYDAASKNFTLNIYDKGGDALSGTYTVSGNRSVWTMKSVVAAKRYQIRGVDISAANLMSFTRKAEISTDGKTWTPFYEARYTKGQPAPKK